MSGIVPSGIIVLMLLFYFGISDRSLLLAVIMSPTFNIGFILNPWVAIANVHVRHTALESPC